MFLQELSQQQLISLVRQASFNIGPAFGEDVGTRSFMKVSTGFSDTRQFRKSSAVRPDIVLGCTGFQTFGLLENG